MPRRTPAILLFLAVSALTEACAVRNQQLTPVQQVAFTTNQSLSALATINKAVAQDVIVVATSRLISKDLANSVLTWQRLIGVDIVAAETIQRGSGTPAEKALALKTAFLNAAKFPPEIAALLNSSQTDQAVLSLITTVQTIVSLLKALTQ